MASRLHSKKEKKTGKNKESFPLTRCWRHVLWADDVRLLLSAQGEIKSKASIIIYHGGGGRKNKGGSHGFQGNRGEKQSLLTRYKGGATEHCLPMEGIIEILQSFGEGDARLISGWYNKKPPTPSLDNRYSDWSQTWQSLHGWQYTHTLKKK